MMVQNIPSKPVFLFDGDCGFCKGWVDRWRATVGDAVEFGPAPDERFPEIDPATYQRASVFVDHDGKVSTGCEAVFRMLACAPAKRHWLYAYGHLPGFRHAAEWSYERIARNRLIFSRVFGPPARYGATVALFLRFLGVVYLCAFVSLWTQINGLIGSKGILPIGDLIQAAGQQLHGSQRWHLLPTFCWWGASDSSLTLQCAAGTISAAALVLGILPGLMLPLLWLLWLSLTVAGQDFMSFQWESLLLESGFLAIFLSPITWRLKSAEPTHRSVVLFFFRWLLFRFMFLSGIVKLLSGDPAWRDLTALHYHFGTQPLPTLLAWYAAKMPDTLLKLQTAVMYGIELLLPFLVFGKRWMRLIAFVGFVALQIGIAITGNYGYFNLLTVVLSVLLLDDSLLFWRRKFSPTQPLSIWRCRTEMVHSGLFVPAAIIIVVVSCVTFFSALGRKRDWPAPLSAVYEAVEPFRSVNSYGLFAVMTKSRPEIIVQGSDDGEHWSDYEFKYKPGDLNHAPRFIAPHQPRLDWQMWFAALSHYQQNRWFVRFCVRLIEGSPAVLELIAHNPFPEKPPRFIRAMAYDYEFTTAEERKRSGRYWRRKNERVYLPAIGLRTERKQ
jgi:predicted DCC family thiol-disulfide oxidoreductase YuxK